MVETRDLWSAHTDIVTGGGLHAECLRAQLNLLQLNLFALSCSCTRCIYWFALLYPLCGYCYVVIPPSDSICAGTVWDCHEFILNVWWWCHRQCSRLFQPWLFWHAFVFCVLVHVNSVSCCMLHVLVEFVLCTFFAHLLKHYYPVCCFFSWHVIWCCVFGLAMLISSRARVFFWRSRDVMCFLAPLIW